MTTIEKIVPAIMLLVGTAAAGFSTGAKAVGGGSNQTSAINMDNAQSSLKWFSISGTHAPTSQVPPSDATYIGEGVTAPEEADDCTGSKYQCVSGFLSTQVTASNQLNGLQAPYDHSHNRD